MKLFERINYTKYHDSVKKDFLLFLADGIEEYFATKDKWQGYADLLDEFIEDKIVYYFKHLTLRFLFLEVKIVFIRMHALGAYDAGNKIIYFNDIILKNLIFAIDSIRNYHITPNTSQIVSRLKHNENINTLVLTYFHELLHAYQHDKSNKRPVNPVTKSQVTPADLATMDQGVRYNAYYSHPDEVTAHAQSFALHVIQKIQQMDPIVQVTYLKNLNKAIKIYGVGTVAEKYKINLGKMYPKTYKKFLKSFFHELTSYIESLQEQHSEIKINTYT